MSRKALVVLTVVLLVVAGIAYLLFSHGRTATEAVELLDQGGEKLLRERARPARGSPRVVLIALDGVGDAVLREALAAGAMPHLQALLGAPAGDNGVFPAGYWAPDVLSILPSTTMAAWSAVYTGEPPAMNGVPGNEWFVREEMRFYAPAPVSVADPADALRMYTDGLVGAALRVPTVYERADVRSYVSMAPVHRGADFLTIPQPREVAELFAAAARGVSDDDPVEREVFAEIDREGMDMVLSTLDRRGVADFQVVYFPGVDLFTHAAANPLQQQRGYLADVVDPALGALLDAYAQVGALDSTYVVIVADHGHTPVINDDLHALEAEGTDEPPEVLRQAGFRPRPLVLGEADDAPDFQSAFAYQGALAYIYLADRSSCPTAGDPCEWSRPPRLREDIIPVVQAFDAANRHGAGVPALRGALDLIIARLPTDDRASSTLHVFDGEALVPIADHLRANPRPDLLQLEERLEGLANGPFGDRAGDVLLLARTGEEIPIEQRFYFSGIYHSWHGSPHALDSRIPLIVARRGGSGSEIRERVERVVARRRSQMDVTPLVLHLLNRP